MLCVFCLIFCVWADLVDLTWVRVLHNYEKTFEMCV